MPQRLFIISDLHAFDGAQVKSDRPSYFDTSLPVGEGDNPVHQLKEFITKCSISADKLICCGDLADKAYPPAIERAWRDVHEIKAKLNATDIYTSVGNHDVDSRHKYNDFDAKGVLLGLEPKFPFADEAVNNQFWTHHFSIIDDSINARYVILNSSGFHGECSEHDHGRVADRTLKRMISALNLQGRRKINVLICHHHPQKMSELKLGDYDDMKGGYELLNALDAIDFGPWLILHGHKHYPKLTYATGGASTPVIFSAGSCAAIAYPEIAQTSGNQVYLITLHTESMTSTSCLGEFESWSWIPGRGWLTAQAGTGLPSKGGFGFRGDLGMLAAEVVEKFPKGGRWRDILNGIPNLRYVIPSDTQNLIRLLITQHRCSVEEGKDGIPILIDRL